MKKETFNNSINMKNINTERTYFFPNNKSIHLEKLDTLVINSDHSHSINLLNKQIVTIPNNWLAFSAISPSNDFSFNVVKENEVNDFSTWMCLQGLEKSRTYIFDNMEYIILNPKKVYIKKSGSHKVIDNKGKIHYITKHFNEIKSDRS
jgi:hypothetical protein